MKFFYSTESIRSGGFSSFFILQGTLLILLGVLIVMFPALLQIMVATFFILIGLLVLGFGLTMRKMARGFTDRGNSSFDI